MTDSYSPNGKPADASDTGAALPFGVSQQQYDSALADAKSRGIVPEATTSKATADEAAAVAAFPTVENPAQYDLGNYPVAADGNESDARKFDELRRSWLVAGQVPRELGRSLIAAATDAERRLSNLTPEQRELKAGEARATLANLWRDKTESNIALAAKLVDHIESKSPGIKQYLAASGAANDPMVIAQLWMQAERFLATGGKL